MSVVISPPQSMHALSEKQQAVSLAKYSVHKASRVAVLSAQGHLAYIKTAPSMRSWPDSVSYSKSREVFDETSRRDEQADFLVL